jgi:hypothetical protein
MADAIAITRSARYRFDTPGRPPQYATARLRAVHVQLVIGLVGGELPLPFLVELLEAVSQGAGLRSCRQCEDRNGYRNRTGERLGHLHTLTVLQGACERQHQAGSSGEEETLPTPDEVVLGNFMRDGRIITMPAKRSKRIVLLNHVAQLFDIGVRYSESDVNRKLRNLHDDYAALRRYLVDEDFLSREGGEYWRTGGSVDG